MTQALENPLAIIVVNYGSHELLARNLAQLDVAASIVVVDSFSSASERANVAQLALQRSWQLVTPDRNVGFGAGMNLGVERAIALGCEVMLLLNPDVELARDTVSALHRASLENPMRMLTPRLDHRDGRRQFAGGQIDLRTGMTTSRPDEIQTGRGRWLSGACLVVHRDMWEILGGFDPDYFMYWEDIDLTQRCLAAGGELLVEHGLRVIHDVGGTQTSSGKSNLYCYYNCRNRLLFARRNLEPRQQLRWVRLAPRYCVRVVRRNPSSYLIRHPGLAVAALAGTTVGVAATVASLVREALRKRVRFLRR